MLLEEAGSRISSKEGGVTPSLPPASKDVSFLPEDPPPLQESSFCSLGKEGLTAGMSEPWGQGGIRPLPQSVPGSPSQFLALGFHSGASTAAKDSRGTWQARAATRWFGTWATAWAGSQASEAASARPQGPAEWRADPESSSIPQEVAGVQAAARAGGGSGVPLPCPARPEASLPSHNDAASRTSRSPACRIPASG